MLVYIIHLNILVCIFGSLFTDEIVDNTRPNVLNITTILYISITFILVNFVVISNLYLCWKFAFTFYRIIISIELIVQKIKKRKNKQNLKEFSYIFYF